MSLLHLVFLCFGICFAATAESSKFYSWRLDSSRNVTAYQKITSALSAISCVGKCTGHSQCDSCAYDRESGTCYLQVQTASDSVGGSLQVFTGDVWFGTVL
ncbi:hypothetical protein V1264_004758 [Littorina saxatilis]|uniref:Apple domain-containing protein n=1 Tax=Littorina saxatilis TaxID=31220 RepID=A0AAN9B2Q5_9CAEN